MVSERECPKEFPQEMDHVSVPGLMGWRLTVHWMAEMWVRC